MFSGGRERVDWEQMDKVFFIEYGDFSALYFPVFGMITGISQSEYMKIWTRKNSVFGPYSRI